MTIGGTTSGTNAGSYNATFTPGSNYQWTDGCLLYTSALTPATKPTATVEPPKRETSQAPKQSTYTVKSGDYI